MKRARKTSSCHITHYTTTILIPLLLSCAFIALCRSHHVLHELYILLYYIVVNNVATPAPVLYVMFSQSNAYRVPTYNTSVTHWFLLMVMSTAAAGVIRGETFVSNKSLVRSENNCDKTIRLFCFCYFNPNSNQLVSQPRPRHDIEKLLTPFQAILCHSESRCFINCFLRFPDYFVSFEIVYTLHRARKIYTVRVEKKQIV